MEQIPNIKTSPRDFFLHLLAIITLYASAISFTTLLFQYINYFLPDPLTEGQYILEYITGAIRWSVASLIVIFPAYFFITRFLNKAYAATPYLRNLRIRRWLIYFTLFVTALIIIGDIVVLIYGLLGGIELTLRFILKAISIIFTTGIIFWYYRWDLSEDKKTKIQPFAYGISALIAVAIIGAFFIVGSPKSARLREADNQRVQNLSEIQSRIVVYFQGKQKLPKALTDLNDNINIQGFIVPRDPETGADYEYRTTGLLSFELCGTFNLASQTGGRSSSMTTKAMPPAPAGPAGKEIQSTWDHGSGRFCFDRGPIDKDFYPPLNKQ